VPWATAVRSLGLVLDSKLVFRRHLHTVTDKATGGWCNICLLLAPDSTLTHSNNKLLLRSTLTHAASVCSSTSPTNYLTLQESSQNVSESSVITQAYPQFPPALHSTHSAHPRYNPPTYSQIVCSLLLTAQPAVQQIFQSTWQTNMYRQYRHNRPQHTGLFEMTVGGLTTCHTQYTWDSRISIFLFNPLNAEFNPICHLLAFLGAHHILHISRIRVNRTTLQFFVTYLTGALYVHPLWFYKHQHDNRVRSILFVACQRWWFQWRFWFVPAVPGYLREEEEHKPDPWRNLVERTTYCYLKCIVYDKLLKPRQSF